MLYSPDVEDYADGLLVYLRGSDLRNKLDFIQEEKGDNLYIPTPLEIRYGVIGVEEAGYPAVYIFPTSEDLEWDNAFVRKVQFSYTVEIYDAGIEPEILERKVNRLTRAVAEVLMENETTGRLVISSVQHPPIMSGMNGLLKGSMLRIRYQAYVERV